MHTLLNTRLTILLLFLALPAMAVYLPTSHDDMVKHADHIVVGHISAIKPRLNETGTIVVRDVTLFIEKTIYGNNQGFMTFTIGGGKLGQIETTISGTPKLKIGQRIMLLMQDPSKPLLNPIVGGETGLFVADTIPATGLSALSQTPKSVTTLANGNTIAFDTLVEQFTHKAKTLKTPFGSPQTLDTITFDLIRRPETKQYNPRSAENCGETPVTQGAFSQNIFPYAEPTPLVEDSPINPNDDATHAAQALINTPDNHLQTLSSAASSHDVSLPVIFVPTAENDPHIKKFDSYAMAEWNRYLYAFKTYKHNALPWPNEWAVGNRCNDSAGFVSNETLIHKAKTGGYNLNEIALSIITTTSGLFGFNKKVEVDIVLNPAYSWTTNYRESYLSIAKDPFGSRLLSTKRYLFSALLHEFGHALGFEHIDNDLSIMNFIDSPKQAYGRLHLHDLNRARTEFFNHRKTDVWDVAMQFYVSGGHKQYRDQFVVYNQSGLQNNFIAGDTLTISGGYYENLSTGWVKVMNIEWYLCKALHDTKNCRHLTTSYKDDNYIYTLNRGEAMLVDNIEVKLPENLKSNQYYILAYVGRGDKNKRNNFAWIPTPYTIHELPEIIEIDPTPDLTL